MEAFFSGTVIILYLFSRYAAEYIFVFCCCLPALGGAAAMLVLRFGGAGGMLSARRNQKKFWRKGVVAGGERQLFYDRCVRRTSPAFRAGYSLYLEGKTTSSELAYIGVESVRARKSFALPSVVLVGVCASLLVFLTFYFLVPIGETLLRAAVCAFHGALSAAAFHLLSFSYLSRAEKAARRFASALDGLLLRQKEKEGRGGEDLSFVRQHSVTPDRQSAKEKEKKEEDPDLLALQAMLRDLDRAPIK